MVQVTTKSHLGLIWARTHNPGNPDKSEKHSVVDAVPHTRQQDQILPSRHPQMVPGPKWSLGPNRPIWTPQGPNGSNFGPNGFGAQSWAQTWTHFWDRGPNLVLGLAWLGLAWLAWLCLPTCCCLDVLLSIPMAALHVRGCFGQLLLLWTPRCTCG